MTASCPHGGLKTTCLFCDPSTIVDPPGGVDPAVSNNPERKDLRREAETFLMQNPGLYALFEKFALEMLQAGRTFGINLLRERVRWEVLRFWSADDRGFKFNNNHSPYIARRLIEDHPRLESLIRCRQTRY